MAVSKIYLSKRVSESGLKSLLKLGNQFELIAKIREVLADEGIDIDGKYIYLDADSNTYLDATVDNVIDFYVNGALDFTFSANAFTAKSGSVIATNTITETTALANITMSKPVIYQNGSAAINTSATATAAQVKTGRITSTSVAGVTITLPTGTLLGAALEATGGTVFDLIVDNTAGASTVTIADGVNNIASQWNVYQDVGGAPLDVVSGVTGIGIFRFIFSSATACTFVRIG